MTTPSLSFSGNEDHGRIYYSIKTHMGDFTIADDFNNSGIHERTRIRVTNTGLGQHLYVKQYYPFNHDILCKRKTESD